MKNLLLRLFEAISTGVKLFLLLAMLQFIPVSPLVGQWVQTNGPAGSAVRSLTSSGNAIIAATDFGVYHSTNGGETWWSSINKGISMTPVSFVYNAGYAIFLGQGATIMRSVDGGDLWNYAGTTHNIPLCMTLHGTKLFAGTGAFGVLVSNDSATTWLATGTMTGAGIIRTVWSDGANLWAGSDGGAFISTNGGTNWTLVSGGLPNTMVTAFTRIGSKVYAGTTSGVYQSTNGGAQWSAINSGLSNQHV